MKRIIAVILAVLLCVSLTGCGAYFDALEDMGSAYQDILGGKTDDSSDEQNNDSSASSGVQITMPYDKYHYTGNERPVGHIVSELEELGFTNIKTIEVEKGWYYFAVEDVKIYADSSDKSGRFDKGDVFYSDSLVEVYYYGGPLEDGMVQETNIFTIEKQLKAVEGYNWSNEHSVIEGRTGYFGDCYCEESDIWCSLYGNDLEEITTANIDVFEKDYELLITFASFFDTSLIDGQAVEQWIRNSNPKNGSVSKVFGDAEFTLSYGAENDEKYTLYITALE